MYAENEVRIFVHLLIANMLGSICEKPYIISVIIIIFVIVVRNWISNYL